MRYFTSDAGRILQGTAKIARPESSHTVTETRLSAKDFDVELWQAGQDWYVTVWDRERCRIRVRNLVAYPREVYMIAQEMMRELGGRLQPRDRVKVSERNKLHEVVAVRWERPPPHGQVKTNFSK